LKKVHFGHQALLFTAGQDLLENDDDDKDVDEEEGDVADQAVEELPGLPEDQVIEGIDQDRSPDQAQGYDQAPARSLLHFVTPRERPCLGRGGGQGLEKSLFLKMAQGKSSRS
jgi:hypothetical protein